MAASQPPPLMAQEIPRAARGAVLVVEDDHASAELLAALLDEEGFQPVVCPDGSSVMERFEAERPVAVLIDWVIPGGPGIELCRQIRLRDSVVPIVFVSGRTDEASVSRGLDAGADDFPTKPVDLLVRRLRSKLSWSDWITAVPGYGYRLERPRK